VHLDFDQTSPDRLGQYADLIAEMDYCVGQIVDCIDQAGITDNTLVVFSSDNAAGGTRAFQGGSNGPFHGSFVTPPWEGSMRTAAMVRWPGTVPAGVVTEEMLSAHDWYTTFAALAGASDKVPTDRPIDGIDASKFLLGESATSGREGILFFGPDGSLMSVKWHNLKVILRYSEGMDQPIVTPQWPMVFDLASDPGELYNIMDTKLDMGWMIGVALKFVADHEKSIGQYPNIKTGEEFKGCPAATSETGS
jgi:arylsulfatase